MPFDLVAWYESQAADLISAVNVGESIYHTKDDDIYIKKRAPFLGALCSLAVSTPGYIEVRQPSLKIPYRFSRAELQASSKYIEGYYHMWDRPLPLYAGEKANVFVENATSEVSWIVAMLLSGKCTVADIARANPTHIIRGESGTAAVADAWTLISIVWSHDLPKGRYAIVGMGGSTWKSAGPTLAACRLVIPDITWRPGAMLNISGSDDLNHTNAEWNFYHGNLWPLMREIAFEHDEMPSAEVLAGAANSSHVIELLLQKIG